MSRVQVAGQLPLIEPADTLNAQHPRLRVLIPCSKGKVASAVVADRRELDDDRDAVHQRLAPLARPARELYAGRAYQRSLAAVDRFALTRPDIPISLHIASAGYGIVGSSELLVPYEAVMGSGARQWAARGRTLGMPEQALALVETSEVTLIALSQPYSVGAAIADMAPRDGTAIVIGVGQHPSSPRLRPILASRPQARAFQTTEREVASVLISTMLDLIARGGLDLVHQLPADPLAWSAE